MHLWYFGLLQTTIYSDNTLWEVDMHKKLRTPMTALTHIIPILFLFYYLGGIRFLPCIKKLFKNTLTLSCVERDWTVL